MRILVVEDEVKIATLLKESLVAKRYVVDVCYDGEAGFEQALEETYDLIILDLGLPTMDGVEVCRRLRAEKVSVPILMLTARDAIESRVTGLDVGADDYLIKPFSLDELLARIRSLLRRVSYAKTSVLSVADLIVDQKTFSVTRAGKPIHLSAKEYALLEYLLREPTAIMSKSTLLDQVWGGDVDMFSNVVDVYVGYLRNKLNKPFPQSPVLLETIKGMGYRLLPQGTT
jgi:two-component system OmpR family response regulator